MNLLIVYSVNNFKCYSNSALPKSFYVAIKMSRKSKCLTQEVYLVNTVKRYEAMK